MRTTLTLIMLFVAANSTLANEQARKVYQCAFMENAPYGVTAWSQSDMVRTGQGKESRFVPYNSDAAKGLILDATTLRDVNSNPEFQGRETSFYMVYNSKGWYIYIHCSEPDIRKRVDLKKDVALEIFFSPGLEKVPYYQMIVRQLPGTVKQYDWGMPHRHYRSLKDGTRVESLPIDTGYATFIFIPWECLYDRLPVHGDQWRFSLMRWGPSMTWGGRVHDTGNFGHVRFVPPSESQKEEIEKGILRVAWFQFQATARKATTLWSDEEVGDIDFYNESLKPLIERHMTLGESLGDPDDWNAETVEKCSDVIEDWMEFKYVISELRSMFLMDKMFSDKR